MKIILLWLFLAISGSEITDWKETVNPAVTNYKVYTSIEAQTSKWVGCTDPNYSFESDRLVYERTVKDEDGKDVLVKTYKKPIEIIADIKSETVVHGVAGNIEKNAVGKFGGALKGFVWLDKISGGGEVVLPFTAPHIFIAKGDRLNPVLTEISTDTSADNYYEVFEGKTHVYVKSFSGIGGAAGAPPTLIAFYPMNEKTASDNDELITDGDMTVAGSWTKGTGWSIAGGVAHCDGTQIIPTLLYQSTGIVVGRKYKVIFTVSNYVTGWVRIAVGENFSTSQMGDDTYSQFLIATGNSLCVIQAGETFVGDIDDVSIKLCAAEDSSGNDHDMLMAQDTDAISVAGKINGAFDFTPNAFGEINDHDDFTPAGTPFSISVWIYMHDATNFMIVSKGVYNVDGEWRFLVGDGDRVEFIKFDESVADCFIGRRYLTTLDAYENKWVHLVGTSDGGILSSGNKIYLNGVRVDNGNLELNAGSFVAVENLDHVVWIGRYSSNYANGVIDNVTFFSVELSQDDINILYNGGAATEILAELDSQIRPRRHNLSPLPLRRRYEF